MKPAKDKIMDNFRQSLFFNACKYKREKHAQKDLSLSSKIKRFFKNIFKWQISNRRSI